MKQVTLIVLGCFALLTNSQAASFDCEKASNHVEKLICTNDELSKLDEEMQGFYETAMLDESIARKVKLRQIQWLKERNSCFDVACVKSAYETREIFPDKKARAVLPPRKFQASLDSKDWVAVFMNSKIGEKRADALRNINNQDHPDRHKYNEIGLRDSSSKVRDHAAFFYQTELDKLTPILLKIITSDSDSEVRFSAAMNLSCNFSCNGADYVTKDIRALENGLPLIKIALKDEKTGKKMLEILDSVWCDMSKNSQKLIAKLLASDLSTKFRYEGQEMVNTNLDLQAKAILNRHQNKSCSISVR